MPTPITDPDCIIRLVRQWLEWNGGIGVILFIASSLGVSYHTVKRAIRHDKGEHVEIVGHSARLKDRRK